MQREPVPAGLIRGERLAAPFPVHPGLACDLYGLVVDRDAAARLEKRLAEIIRGLAALGFFAVTAIALQHQRATGITAQRTGKLHPRRFECKRRDHVVAHWLTPAHFPGIDPGEKGFCFDAGLADAAAREGFAVAVGVGACHGRVAHPDLLIGPAFLLRARLYRLAKQGPLRAMGGAGRIHKISRHVPPLDPEVRMRAVIFWKTENLARSNRRKPFAAHAKPGKTLRQSALAAKPDEREAGREGPAGYRGVIAHWRKS